MQIINILYLQWFNISSWNMPHSYNKYHISKPNIIHVAITFKYGTFCLLYSVFPAFCFSSCNFIQYLSFEIIQSIHINLALFACSNNKSRQNYAKKKWLGKSTVLIFIDYCFVYDKISITFVTPENQKVVGLYHIQLFDKNRLIKYWSMI